MLAFVVGNDNFKGGALAVSLYWAEGAKLKPLQSLAKAEAQRNLPFRLLFEPPLAAGRVPSEGTWFRGTLVLRDGASAHLLLAVRRMSADEPPCAVRVPVFVSREAAVSRLEIPTSFAPYRTLSSVCLAGSFAVPENPAQAGQWIRAMGLDKSQLLLPLPRVLPAFATFSVQRPPALAGITEREVTAVDESGERVTVTTKVRRRRLEI